MRKDILPEDRLKELRNLAITQLKTLGTSKYVIDPDNKDDPSLEVL